MPVPSSELINTILKEAAQAPSFLKEVYGDLAKPGVTEVGKALSYDRKWCTGGLHLT